MTTEKFLRQNDPDFCQRYPLKRAEKDSFIFANFRNVTFNIDGRFNFWKELGKIRVRKMAKRRGIRPSISLRSI